MNPLARHEVISRFLALYERPSYLEIGVNQGETFNVLQAANKVAVDPQFLFDTNQHAIPGKIEFHSVTSDVYFGDPGLATKKFHVIYLDGLHTFEQTLRDLLNALTLVADTGVIIIDDVLPSSFDASLPDMQQVFTIRSVARQVGANWPFDGAWMGDVFRVVFFLKAFLQQYSYATVLESHGQTVVWRGARPANEVGGRSIANVANLDFRHTILDRASFNIQPIDTIVSAVLQAAAATPRLST